MRIALTLCILFSALFAHGQALDAIYAQRPITNIAATDLFGPVQTNSAGAAGQKFSGAMQFQWLLRSLAGLPEWDDLTGSGASGEVSQSQLNSSSNSVLAQARASDIVTSNALVTLYVAADAALQSSIDTINTALSGILVRAITNIPQDRKLYVAENGNNTTAQRGRLDKPYRDPRAAKNAAQAGDLIHVLNGTYVTNDLLKNGVNWLIEGNLAYTNSATDGGIGIFDDRLSGAVTSSIVSLGTISHVFDRNTNFVAKGAIYTTNPATRLYVKGVRLEQSAGLGANESAAIWQKDGDGIYEFEEVVDPLRGVDINTDPDEEQVTYSATTAAYWGAGPMHVRIKRMDMTWYGIYSLEPDGNTTPYSLYFTGDYIKSDASCFYHVGRTANYKMWLSFLEATSSNSVFLIYGAGKFYANGQKFGATSTENRPTIDIDSPALTVVPLSVWITGQKVESINHSWLRNNNSNATAFINIADWSDGGTMSTGMVLKGGTTIISGGDARLNNGTIAHITGGTNYFNDITLNSRGTNATSSATNNRPVFVAGGVNTFKGVTAIAPDNGFSIYAPSSQSISIEGALSSAFPLTANITTTGPTNLFGGPVVVPGDAYASGWNGSSQVPTKDAIYDKIETLASQVNLTAASNSLVTLSSNNVRVLPGAGGITVSVTSTSGVHYYTVTDDDAGGGGGGSGTMTTIRSGSTVVGTNLVSFLLTNGNDVAWVTSSNAGVVTITGWVTNTTGTEHIVRSNSPTMFAANFLGTTDFDNGSGGVIRIDPDDALIHGGGTVDLRGSGAATTGIIITDSATTSSQPFTQNGTMTLSSNLVMTPRPLVAGGTNLFIDGSRGSKFVHTHNYGGQTNVWPTNLTVGGKIELDVFVSIGSTLGFPWATASQYIGGQVTPRSNIWSRVTIERIDSTTTNISIRTLDAALVAGYKTALETNAAANTIAVRSSEQYTNYADGNITINCATDVTANWTNAVAGNRSITLSTPVIGTSGSLAFVSDGSARTLPVLSPSAAITFMSTNWTATATNLLTTASKRTIFSWRVGMATDGVSTNLSVWAVNQTP